nr:MAG TPA: hypothetical protein [Caudoviricetes sp.]
MGTFVYLIIIKLRIYSPCKAPTRLCARIYRENGFKVPA